MESVKWARVFGASVISSTCVLSVRVRIVALCMIACSAVGAVATCYCRGNYYRSPSLKFLTLEPTFSTMPTPSNFVFTQIQVDACCFCRCLIDGLIDSDKVVVCSHCIDKFLRCLGLSNPFMTVSRSLTVPFRRSTFGFDPFSLLPMLLMFWILGCVSVNNFVELQLTKLLRYA